MRTRQRQQFAGSLPCPVIIGSALNAYGLIRSLGERGVKSIVVDCRFGMASVSRHVSGRWRLPASEPSDASIAALFEHAAAFDGTLMLIPTNEAWAAAIARRRREFEEFFLLPLPAPETSLMTISKDLMHLWCVKNNIRVPDTEIFKPGENWRAFLDSASAALPVIVKPQTKCIEEENEEIGFSTRVFWTADELQTWGARFGECGPASCTIWQRFLCGPTTNIVAFHGYRAADGRLFMAGLTKLRIQPPICGGSTSAAYMRADRQATKTAQDLLEKLDYRGFFDLEFMRNDSDGQLYFIELNPRPGLPNYGATAAGVNFVWEGYADQIGLATTQSRVVDQSDYLWIRFFADFFLYVIVYRAMGLGIRPAEWWRSIRKFRWVDTTLNANDPLVMFVGASELGLSAIKRSKRSLRRFLAYL